MPPLAFWFPLETCLILTTLYKYFSLYLQISIAFTLHKENFLQQAETITENFNTPTPKAQGTEVVSKKKKQEPED